ncbi:hypothetical protein DFJ77DRAFT_508481 [Powellomyces hirtus]|nr:hypothetical protein DFJ77DRAFT_508481 [Powellomyces hirtus]
MTLENRADSVKEEKSAVPSVNSPAQPQMVVIPVPTLPRNQASRRSVRSVDHTGELVATAENVQSALSQSLTLMAGDMERVRKAEMDLTPEEDADVAEDESAMDVASEGGSGSGMEWMGKSEGEDESAMDVASEGGSGSGMEWVGKSEGEDESAMDVASGSGSGSGTEWEGKSEGEDESAMDVASGSGSGSGTDWEGKSESEDESESGSGIESEGKSERGYESDSDSDLTVVI